MYCIPHYLKFREQQIRPMFMHSFINSIEPLFTYIPYYKKGVLHALVYFGYTVYTYVLHYCCMYVSLVPYHSQPSFLFHLSFSNPFLTYTVLNCVRLLCTVLLAQSRSTQSKLTPCLCSIYSKSRAFLLLLSGLRCLYSTFFVKQEDLLRAATLPCFRESTNK